MSGDKETVLEGRLHPVTPWRRTWAVACGVAGFLFRDLQELVHSARTWPTSVTASLAAAATLAAGGYGYASWRSTSWRLDADALHVRTGILLRRRHRFELAHLQEVDVTRPFLGRLIGVCSLRLSVSGQHAQLSYLSEEQAGALREALHERMAADGAAPAPPGPEQFPLAAATGAEPVVTVAPRTLALALLLEVHTLLRAAVTLGTGLVPYLLSSEPLTLLSALGAAGAAWRMTGWRWARWHGWTLRALPGGYRVDFGLFDRQQQTLRHDRTHAVLLTQPVLWRRRDWVQVHLATAGRHRPILLAPVATRDQADQLIRHLYGPDGLEATRMRIPAPKRARYAAVLSHTLSCVARHGYFAVWRGLFLRNVVHLCPAAKVQFTGLSQGPWQRRLGLATVHAALAGGPHLSARHRDIGEAVNVVADLRSTRGRRRLLPQQSDASNPLPEATA
ncbi:PH domain-containing protein [Kitasatospora sp. NPDC085464]|uniref:PH domain-containing protein n=1 Tax=Kitasatospora sp. NPDC085464 TaxID=3364063 RepID=UPI0037CAB3DD